MKQSLNGNSSCAAHGEWEEIAGKIQETHEGVTTIAAYCPYLKNISESSDYMKNKLTDAATGKNQLDIKVAILLFKILGFVIVCQQAVIVFVLTGQKFNLFGLFEK
jgi:hypothetical protein